MVVAICITLVVLFLIWKKVPAAIGRSLDKKIEAIREQLNEAESIRKDAEALKAEYEAKAVAADKEAAAMVERAKHEAEAIVAKAAEDAEALVERRQAMAEAKMRPRHVPRLMSRVRRPLGLLRRSRPGLSPNAAT